MAGINRALSQYRTFSELRKAKGVECVFLSHQKRDKSVCETIAEYLLDADIDVYFDEYDADLKFEKQKNNPKGITNCIKKGINNSSHMLCIISPNTISSKWVPWEIGYGYDKTDLSVLTLKGIEDSELPAYLLTAELIRGTRSLNRYLSKITSQLVSLMESTDLIKSYNDSDHPLDSVLDWNL